MRTKSLANSEGKKKRKKKLRVWQTFKRRQSKEDGKEARVLAWVSEQDPSEGEKTGGNAQSQIFELPDAETIKVKLRGVTILGSGGVMTGIVARLALPRVWREAEVEGR